MPDKSKSQMRWSFWAESHGKLPRGTAKRWADITPSIARLPERVGSRKSARNKKPVARKSGRNIARKSSRS